jgi:hypothetical protein
LRLCSFIRKPTLLGYAGPYNKPMPEGPKLQIHLKSITSSLGKPALVVSGSQQGCCAGIST